MKYKIFNEDCIRTMERLSEKGLKVDVILTSPPYNISRVVNTENALTDHHNKYKYYKDNKNDEDYLEWIEEIFNNYDKVLVENGVVLFNINYATDVSHKNRKPNELMYRVVNRILEKTNFTIGDTIIWKKSNAMPNSSSKNKLTRIVEFIFVFCRDSEFTTYNSNKQVVSINKRTNQEYYENILNFVTAKNNNGSNILNKATYSTELCEQLLNIYARPNSVIYDSFNGTGTTGVASLKLGHKYIGSEIDIEQVEYSIERIERECTNT